ncbi:MAG: secondary thiamine-phosphate synthase enzyme YjbQ [Thermoleophilia bacterium]
MRERTITAEVWYLRAELEREVIIITTGAPSPGDTTRVQAVAADVRDPKCSSSTDDLRGLRFAVIGAGRLGISLGLALVGAGCVLRGHAGRSSTGRARAESLLGTPCQATVADLVAATLGPREADLGSSERSKSSEVPDPPIFLLTVPDAELPAAAQALADAVAEHLGHSRSAAPERRSSPTVSGAPIWAVAHTSGATPVSVLNTCAAQGALTLSLHPLQTFSDPSRGPELLCGAAVAVTPGPDGAHREQARRLGERLARAVGGRPFLLEERHRTLYHTAAVVASNYLVTIEHAAERLFLLAGLPADDVIEAFLPLAQGALDNIKSQGTVPALTGPLSRGDGGTVAAHLRALDQVAPDLADLYRTLGRATLALVRSRGELPADVIETLERIMSTTAERVPDTATGAFTVMTRYATFSTQGEGDVIDLTDQIGHLLRESGLTSGTVTVFAPGATGAVTTLEFEPGVVHDFKQLFGRIIPADDPYRHNLLLQDGNGHSHVRAGLLGPSLVIPFVNGRLTLGTWQEAVFVCFDNRPRDRTVIVQFMGVSEG